MGGTTGTTCPQGKHRVRRGSQPTSESVAINVYNTRGLPEDGTGRSKASVI